MNPGERQNHVITTSTGSFIQPQTPLTFITAVLIFSSNLISYSHKVHGSGSIEGGKILVKQRKQPWGGQAAIYQIHRVSARLRLASPSHSSLRPPCYEAIVWIFMKSDPYQQKTSSLRNLSLARLHYLFSVATLHLVLLHSTVFLPLICISTSLSLALLLYLHLKNPFLMAFLQPFSYMLISASLVFLPVDDAARRSYAVTETHPSVRTTCVPTGCSCMAV